MLPFLIPLLSGLGTWAATGDFKKGLLGGLLGMVPGLIGGLGGAGAGAAAAASKAGATGIGALMSSAAPVAVKEGAKSVLLSSVPGAASGSVGAASGGIGALARSVPAEWLKAATQGGAAQAIEKGASAGNMNWALRAADWAKNHPMSTAGIISTGIGAMMPPGVPKTSQPAVEDIPANFQKERRVIPFGDGSRASTYLPTEAPDANNPYRYGQYSGEHMFFPQNTTGKWLENLPPEIRDAVFKGGKTGASGGRGGRGGGRLTDTAVDDVFKLAGGGMVRGAGDGKSDSIPAKDKAGKVALSDGEFVLSADVVSALGNGSSDAGARKLEEFMANVRRNTYGR